MTTPHTHSVPFRFAIGLTIATLLLPVAARAQYILVAGLSTSIPAGFATPVTNNATFFPLADLTNASQAVFEIFNVDADNLLTISNIALSGPNPSEFHIDVGPIGSIQPFNKGTLAINFVPTSVGANKAATVTITSNDPTNPSFTFAIGGTAMDAIGIKSDLSANPGATEPTLTKNQKTSLFSLKWKLLLRNDEVGPAGDGTALIYGTNYETIIDPADSVNTRLLGTTTFKTVKGSKPGKPGTRKASVKLKNLPADSNQFSKLVVIVLGDNLYEDPYANNALATSYKTIK